MKALSSILVSSVFLVAACGDNRPLGLGGQRPTTDSAEGEVLALSGSMANCAPDPVELAHLAMVGATLGSSIRSLRAVAHRDFGGYRVLAMGNLSAAQTEVLNALTYKQQSVDCDRSIGPGLAGLINNPIVLPVIPGEFGLLLYDIGSQIVDAVNTLNVRIVRRDFNGHRAAAAKRAIEALGNLQVSVNWESCVEVAAATFARSTQSLDRVYAALKGIPERNFAGWRFHAMENVAMAKQRVAAANAVIQSECAKPPVIRGKAIKNPIKLPTSPGPNAQTLYEQAEVLVGVINDLNVTITQRDFEGHRKIAVQKTTFVLSDLQMAIDREK